MHDTIYTSAKARALKLISDLRIARFKFPYLNMAKLIQAKRVSRIRVKAPRGVVLWEGNSPLDGSPIICIATFKNSNRKTGNMIQT